MKKISYRELRNIISYDAETGVIRKLKCRRSDWIGKQAGSINKKGYVAVSIYNKLYLAHRLAWLYIYGKWPEQVDHIDGDKTNNRISNLRLATTSQNVHSQRIRRNNTSGYKGVTFNRSANKWVAQIKINRKQKYLGLFTSPIDAHSAYSHAAKKYFGEFARTS